MTSSELPYPTLIVSRPVKLGKGTSGLRSFQSCCSLRIILSVTLLPSRPLTLPELILFKALNSLTKVASSLVSAGSLSLSLVLTIPFLLLSLLNRLTAAGTKDFSVVGDTIGTIDLSSLGTTWDPFLKLAVLSISSKEVPVNGFSRNSVKPFGVLGILEGLIFSDFSNLFKRSPSVFIIN